jgi:GNAT superfamily N-acetyltransferase
MTETIEHEVVGYSDTTLELGDSFAYAGKFRVPSGKAVARDEDDGTVAALSFSPDRADEDAVRVRYFAVRDGLRGEGIGSSLLGFAAERLLERGYEAVRVSVNNPYAYEAATKAGFVWTGETSGLAELVTQRPPPDGVSDTDERYAEGMRLFAERDLTEPEDAFVRRKLR